MLIYSVYDSKAEAYMQPFFCQAAGQAIREFDNLVNSGDHPVAKHPEDYTLFEMGAWDDLTGEIVGETPKSKGNGLDFKRSD